MFRQIRLAAVLIIAIPVATIAQPPGNFEKGAEEIVGGAEAARALARLEDLSPAAVRGCLKQMRKPPYLPGPETVNKIIESQYLSIADSKRVSQLQAALQPVLDYHERSRMPIYVLWSDHPKAYLVERAVIILTTRMMMIASDEEIRGIIAHELAHEYIWEERVKALKEKDGRLMRECELFCDAVAAFTLKEIGDDPASYGRILERMTIIGITAGYAVRQKSHTHPALHVRKKLNKFLSRQFD